MSYNGWCKGQAIAYDGHCYNPATRGTRCELHRDGPDMDAGTAQHMAETWVEHMTGYRVRDADNGQT